ncbi:MAG: FAD:protein FMN transferase [Leptolinea sp.]|jgi:thiamine biosynthesis lipoprotein|nr:FAD:protein FMN transferase [Leptolinea sp.]
MLADTLREKQTSHRRTHEAMGTVMVHEVCGPYAEESLDAVQIEIERLEGLFSRFLPDSEISQINRMAGTDEVEISFETFEVLSRAVGFSRNSRGLLDVSIGPLVDLWKISRNTLSVPDQDAMEMARQLVNFEDISMDHVRQAAGLRKAGQSIDLGGIGKGYTADKVIEVLRTFGNTSAFSNLGGNVVTLGKKTNGESWKVGIQHPRATGRLIGVVSVCDQSVVTSGDYQRYIISRDGRRFHHLIDPRTGRPAASGLISVTIIADESLTADALSTMVFIAGLDKGTEILKDFPNTHAILVDENLRIFITHDLQDCFQSDRDVHVNIIK